MQDPDQRNYLNQCLKDNEQDLPFDLGAQAYRDRKMPEENPYEDSDYRNEEWWKGWDFAESGDPDQMFDHVAHTFLSMPPK